MLTKLLHSLLQWFIVKDFTPMFVNQTDDSLLIEFFLLPIFGT